MSEPKTQPVKRPPCERCRRVREALKRFAGLQRRG